MKLLAIGKKHEPWIADGVERYQKRLQGPWKCEWILLPHSMFEGQRARQEESRAVLSRLSDRDYVILLDERGMMFDSPTLSHRLGQALETSKQLVFVIGGAYGVSAELETRADLVWSLSALVFPHQLVRLLLVEQLYRAQEIAAHRSYHHV